MDETLFQQFRPVIKRLVWRRVCFVLATLWLLSAFLIWLAVRLDLWTSLSLVNAIFFIGPGILLASVGAVVLTVRNSPALTSIATMIERKFPNLDSTLLTAIEQRPDQFSQYGFMQQEVMRQAFTHSLGNRWADIVPLWQLAVTPTLTLAMLGLLAMVIIVGFGRPITPQSTPKSFSETVINSSDLRITIEPGSTEIERGTGLLILARFDGSIPNDATLMVHRLEEESRSMPMQKSLDDPIFGMRIPSVTQALTYQVQYADKITDTFEVSVFDFPDLIRGDAMLNFPHYTQTSAKYVQNISRLSAVQGTSIDLTFYTNKPLKSATLVSVPDRLKQGTEPSLDPLDIQQNQISYHLVPDTIDPKKFSTTLILDRSLKLELLLEDNDGRQNRFAPRFSFTALENRPPDLKIVLPAKDLEVSALEELQLVATAWDDFGMPQIGLTFSITGEPESEITLANQINGKTKTQVDYLLAMENLGAQPDQLVSYYFWAEDLGPDGKTRRIASDLYFAEVRRFDEIFRQGQQPTAQQMQQQQQGPPGAGAQQASQLADLQKEIMAATWKLIRRETLSSVSQNFNSDVEVISQSQQTALDQLQEVEAEFQEAKSKALAQTAGQQMLEAIEQLTAAATHKSTTDLKTALSKEQAAYQSLLGLRSNEMDVVQQQQQQPSQGQQGQAGNRSQQQMQQLDLTDDTNRYEEQSQAQAESPAVQQQQEDRQVLSRLKELAQRQDDLNQRVKELQSALEEAETNEEKDEIQRRLKSLQEQQQEMLRDSDELLERMQSEENQQRMSQEASQLEDARQNLQESADSLESGQVSRAAAEGTRAQRDLEDLLDEFQNRTAGHFDQEMQELRNEVRDIERQQQEIDKQLSEPSESTQPSQPTLQDAAPDLDLQKQLDQQKQRVEELREQIQETVEQAEAFEPLLAQELYDTYRKSEVDRPDLDLEAASRALQRGWNSEAALNSREASLGIQQLKEGVEEAAQRVLGDETRALRQAQRTLNDLNQQIDEELDANRPRPNDSDQPESDSGAPALPNSNPDPRTEPGQESGQAQDNSDPQPNTDQTNRPKSEQEPQSQDSAGQPGEGQPGGQGSSSPNAPSASGENPPGEPNPNEGRGQGSGGQGNGGQERDQSRPDQRPSLQSLDDAPANLENQGNGGRFSPQMNQGDGNIPMRSPISGDDYRQWSDGLRDVEEMIADPELRAQAARIRQEARAIREDIKRHSAEPDWDLIQMKVAQPLAELKRRVAEEILRRTSDDNLVPLDRDPVPAEFQDAVQRYYQRLGIGQ